MFDFAWSEIALIAAVALIAIGPKDLPVAIRSVTSMIKKARRMASEFQTHVDEMVREADLGDVRNSINELRSFDIKGAIERAVDPDGGLRSTFASNPLEPTPPSSAPVTSMEEIAVSEPAATEFVTSEPESKSEEVSLARSQAGPEAPAFIPPNAIPPSGLTPAPAEPEEAPAFVPPEIARRRQAEG